MSTMNFFEHQDRARKTTRRLYIYYFIAVLFVIVALNVCLLGILQFLSGVDSDSLKDSLSFFQTTEGFTGAIACITGVSSLLIFSGAGIRSSQLKSLNGGQVAESLGGRLVSSNTKDRRERRLLNIVEEMSIASGVPVPKVYILDNENSINAFASGWNTDEAAIAVTKGALDYFNRDELQGVIGHEFSHILNGDMTVDMRMVGLLFGLELIFLCGYFLFRVMLSSSSSSDSSSSSKDSKGGGAIILLLLIGLLIMIIGYIGKAAANIIRMAISRQKEYLADASAVQFTRNPEGIGYALIKIGQINSNNPITNPNAAACGHFFFSSINAVNLWDSHPPLEERIARILPNYNGHIPQSILRDLRNPPGLMNDDVDEQQDNLSDRLKKRFPKRPLDVIKDRLPEQVQEQIGVFGNGVLGVSALNASAQTTFQSSVHTSDNSESLDELIHEPYSVHGVIYALLMNHDPEIQNRQWEILRKNQNEHMLNLVERLIPQVESLSCADKIRVVELSVSALRQMSFEQYQMFRLNIVALTEADQKIDLFEFSLRMILTGRLDVAFGLRKESIQYHSPNELFNEFRLTLGYIAWQGADNNQDAYNAFMAAASQIGAMNIVFLDKNELSMNAFANSLKKIQHSSMEIRKMFFQSFVACINYDGKITSKEEDLISVIGACLNLSYDARSTDHNTGKTI